MCGVEAMPSLRTVPPFIMPALSPNVGAHLLKATRSNDLDEAFATVLSGYLELKIERLDQTTEAFEEKWGIDFSAFKRRMAEHDVPEDARSHSVEQDFWEWEEAETLKTHDQQVRSEWT
jgi:hypothetical protein